MTPFKKTDDPKEETSKKEKTSPTQECGILKEKLNEQGKNTVDVINNMTKCNDE